MTLFFQNDDITLRARANGRTVFDQITEEHRRRRREMASIRQDAMKRKRIREDLAREAEEARARAVQMAAAKQQKKEQWRISWARMINLHKEIENGGRDILNLASVRRLKLKDILREVEERTGYTAEDIGGIARDRHIVRVRHYVFWRARRDTKLSLPEIGRRAKGDEIGFDHSTVFNGIRKFQAALDKREPWAVALAGGDR